MGADGGVCWLTVRHDGDRQPILDLLAPFPLWVKGNLWGDESRTVWRRQNPNGNRIYGPYGTDRGDCPTLEDIPRLMEMIEQIISLQMAGDDPTWGDLRDEHQTCQPCILETRDRTYAQWMECIGDGFPLERMRVKKWMRALCDGVHCDIPSGYPLVGKWETWT